MSRIFRLGFPKVEPQKMKAGVEARVTEGIVLVPYGWEGEANSDLLPNVGCGELIMGYPDQKSLFNAAFARHDEFLREIKRAAKRFNGGDSVLDVLGFETMSFSDKHQRLHFILKDFRWALESFESFFSAPQRLKRSCSMPR
jgi:hypothetical protein